MPLPFPLRLRRRLTDSLHQPFSSPYDPDDGGGTFSPPLDPTPFSPPSLSSRIPIEDRLLDPFAPEDELGPDGEVVLGEEALRSAASGEGVDWVPELAGPEEDSDREDEADEGEQLFDTFADWDKWMHAELGDDYETLFPANASE